MNFTGTNITMIITALSTIFVGWQAYENRKSNQITLDHTQELSQLNKKRESIKAIKRFNDKIIPKIRKLDQTPGTLDNKLNDIIQIILDINSWSTFVTSKIADNNIIGNTISNALKHLNQAGVNLVARKIASIYNIQNYKYIMKHFKIANI